MIYDVCNVCTAERLCFRRHRHTDKRYYMSMECVHILTSRHVLATRQVYIKVTDHDAGRRSDLICSPI